MRLSRANIPLASEDRTHSQAISTSPHNNLAPHFLPGFINLQHFCHSRWRNPVPLSKSGVGIALFNSRRLGLIALAVLVAVFGAYYLIDITLTPFIMPTAVFPLRSN